MGQPQGISRRFWIAASAGAALAQVAAPPPGRRAAITIDDGPAAGDNRDLATFQRITNGLIESFKAEQVPVTIFINERQLNVPGQREERANALVQWLDAGFELGNHAYAHLNASRVSIWQFQDDIVKGTVAMSALLESRGKKLTWFRYPFLASGATAEAHQAYVDFLETRKLRVAPVTVDYKDYMFAGGYSRALRSQDTEAAERIKQSYLDMVDIGFEDAEKGSMEIYGYELPQILLIHCNELNSVTLRETIPRMRKRGYSFISLEEAMSDPAYQRPDTFVSQGGSWLERSALALGKPRPPNGVQAAIPSFLRQRPRQAAAPKSQ